MLSAFSIRFVNEIQWIIRGKNLQQSKTLPFVFNLFNIMNNFIFYIWIIFFILWKCIDYQLDDVTEWKLKNPLLGDWNIMIFWTNLIFECRQTSPKLFWIHTDPIAVPYAILYHNPRHLIYTKIRPGLVLHVNHLTVFDQKSRCTNVIFSSSSFQCRLSVLTFLYSKLK